MKNIADRINYIECSETPLSADIGVVYGEEYLYLFDVGASDAHLEEVLKVTEDKKVRVVISHFHPDHMANLSRLPEWELYQGKNTFGYTHRGNIVEKPLILEPEIEAIPISSSHAKGSLILRVGEYAFLGDATYSTRKGGRTCLNVQLLTEQIKLLESINCSYFLLSHRPGLIVPAKEIIGELKELSKLKINGNPYIFPE